MKPLLILMAALFLAPTSVANEIEEIMAVDRAFSRMSEEQGAQAAFQHFYAKEATALIGGSFPRLGIETITAHLPDANSHKTLTWEPKSAMIAESGDLAYTWGTSVMTYRQDGKITKENHGKYITIWIKQDGEWRGILEMGNSNPGPLPDGYLDK